VGKSLSLNKEKLNFYRGEESLPVPRRERGRGDENLCRKKRGEHHQYSNLHSTRKEGKRKLLHDPRVLKENIVSEGAKRQGGSPMLKREKRSKSNHFKTLRRFL